MKTRFHFLKCAELTGHDKFIRAAADSAELVGDLAHVSGQAYSGGPVVQWWSRLKLIIDLGGMEVSPQLPLLYNHENEPEKRLGEIAAAIDGKTISVSGGVDASTERGKFIVESGKKFHWQLSIGAEILAIEEVSPDDEREINGRKFKGPFLHVKKSLLREVSVCAVGADPETSLQIAASLHINPVQNNLKLKENENMNKKFKQYLQLKYKLGDVDEPAILAHLAKIGSSIEAEQAAFTAEQDHTPEQVNASVAPPAPIQAAGMTPEQIADLVDKRLQASRDAEANRISAINAECTDFSDVAAEAIRAGWSLDQTKLVVAQLRKHTDAITKGSGMNIIMRQDPQIDAQVLTAALCFNQGIAESTIVASFSPQVVENGNKLRGISLKGLLELTAKLEGKPVSVTFDNATIAAAYSTVSLPGILSNVANKKALQTFNAQPVIATRLCKAGDLNDFKESERYRLTDVGDLELVTDGGEIKHGGQTEDKATNKLDTYGKIFVLTRQMIYNDDLGAFLAIPTAMGQRAARKVDQLFHARLLSNPAGRDGKRLFCAEHGNYTTGTAGALSLDALKNARSKFLLATDSDKQPINVMPKFLFVPSVLDALANELVISPTLVGGAAAGPAFNVISKYGLEVVSSPYLQTGTGGQPGSSTGWYLFGDPAQIDTFEIGYLQGRRVPTVEQGAVDFNTLGMGFRVVFDIGVREQGYQGMTFNTGVA